MMLHTQILQILSELHPELDYTKSNDMINDGLIDSFDIILLVTELEKAFQICIPGEQIRAENFKNIRTIEATFLKDI